MGEARKGREKFPTGKLVLAFRTWRLCMKKDNGSYHRVIEISILILRHNNTETQTLGEESTEKRRRRRGEISPSHPRN